MVADSPVKSQIEAMELSLSGRAIDYSEIVSPEHFVMKVHEPYNPQKRVLYMMLELHLNRGGN
jgi:hypothetical protein